MQRYEWWLPAAVVDYAVLSAARVPVEPGIRGVGLVLRARNLHDQDLLNRLWDVRREAFVGCRLLPSPDHRLLLVRIDVVKHHDLATTRRLGHDWRGDRHRRTGVSPPEVPSAAQTAIAPTNNAATTKGANPRRSLALVGGWVRKRSSFDAVARPVHAPDLSLCSLLRIRHRGCRVRRSGATGRPGIARAGELTRDALAGTKACEEPAPYDRRARWPQVQISQLLLESRARGECRGATAMRLVSQPVCRSWLRACIRSGGGGHRTLRS